MCIYIIKLQKFKKNKSFSGAVRLHRTFQTLRFQSAGYRQKLIKNEACILSTGNIVFSFEPIFVIIEIILKNFFYLKILYFFTYKTFLN